MQSSVDPDVGSSALTDRDPRYRRYRFPAEIIARAAWPYFRFPLSLRLIEDILAARSIVVSHQATRLWAEKFSGTFAKQIRQRLYGQFGPEADEMEEADLVNRPDGEQSGHSRRARRS